MNVNNVVRTITIRGKSEDLDKLTGDLTKLATAQQNVAVVSEQSAKRVLSLEDAWKKQSMRLDESARSQANIARETRIADGALREGLITQQQHAERLNLISQRYAVATVQAGKFANQTGLNRYEMLNLSRQIQDVGVSLAGGQSPFVVLTQQGSQILDVFQASTGTVRGFFSQAIGWAGRFASSTAGVVTGIGAIATGALYAASSWSSGQREIDKALIGIGQRSGATADSINKIAEASAGSSKLSISESRTAALEFVKTGNIYTENIGALVGLVKGHAVAIGESSEEASKQLAKIFGGDIAEGADKLNAIYGTISGSTRQYAIELDILGKRQEAIALLARQVVPAIQRASEVTGFWARSWDAVSNTSSDVFSKIGKGLSTLTGVGLSREDRLANAQSALRVGESGLGEQRELAAKIGPDLVPGLKEAERAVVKLREEVARLNKEIAGVGADTDESRLLKIGQDADAAVRALVPFIEQLEKVAKALELIKKAQANPGAQQGLGGANAEAARAGEVLAMNTKNTREETDRLNASTLQLTEKYQTTSKEVAFTLHALEGQLDVAQSVGQMAQIEAQHRTKIAELSLRLSDADAKRIADGERAVALAQIESQQTLQMIALQGQLNVARQSTTAGQINAQYQATIALLTPQIGLVKAIEQAEKQREINVAQINTGLQQQLQTLQDQREVLRGATEVEQARIKAAQEYKKVADIPGGDTQTASRIAALTISNARMREDARDISVSWSVANEEAGKVRRNSEAAAASSAASAAAWERIKAASAQVAYEMAFIPFGVQWADTFQQTYGPGELFQGKDGRYSQFNPSGYTSTINRPVAKMMGSGGYTDAFSAFSSALSGGLSQAQTGLSTSLGGTGIDTNKIAELERLIAVMPTKDQQMSATQSLINELNQKAPSIERDEAVRRLINSLDQLRDATEANTEALRITTDPLITQGHDYLNNLKIGYYKAARGFDGIVRGGIPGVDSVPINIMAQQGERVTVTPPGSFLRPNTTANDNSKNVTVHVAQTVNIADTSMDRRTAKQRAQGFIGAAVRAATG